MASFNRIIIVGNLTRDPDYKQLNTGQATCRLGLASNRQFKSNKTGTMVQEVCYVDIDVWGPQAESCKQYLQKGRAILVEGRLKFDSWKDMEGNTRSKHSIVADRVVFLASANNAEVSNIDSQEIEEKVVPRNQTEKNMLDQIDQIKSRSVEPTAKPAKKSSSKKSAASVEFADISGSGDNLFKEDIEFKDEPPFQDDLPF